MALDKLIYYIPEGIANLMELFPEVPWDDVQEWTVQVKDESGNVLATTRTNKIGCCCPKEPLLSPTPSPTPEPRIHTSAFNPKFN